MVKYDPRHDLFGVEIEIDGKNGPIRDVVWVDLERGSSWAPDLESWVGFEIAKEVEGDMERIRELEETAMKTARGFLKEAHLPKRSDMIEALTEFINAIEATGGCVLDDRDMATPVADPEWVDLGEAYLKACEALCREPKLA